MKKGCKSLSSATVYLKFIKSSSTARPANSQSLSVGGFLKWPSVVLSNNLSSIVM